MGEIPCGCNSKSTMLSVCFSTTLEYNAPPTPSLLFLKEIRCPKNIFSPLKINFRIAQLLCLFILDPLSKKIYFIIFFLCFLDF